LFPVQPQQIVFHSNLHHYLKVASDGYMRTVQNKYIKELYSAAEEPFQILLYITIYTSEDELFGPTHAQKLYGMARSSLLNPASFGFRWPHTITYLILMLLFLLEPLNQPFYQLQNNSNNN
jgi:hypothetical protein